MTLIRQVENAAVIILFWSGALGIPEVSDDGLSELSGPQCPRIVTYTCTALEFSSPTISYFVKDTILAQYVFSSSDTFPIEVMTEPIINGTAQLQNVSFSSRLVSYTNFTLSVPLTELMAFKGSNITCGSDTERSIGLPIPRFKIKEIELDVKLTVVFANEKLVNIATEWYNMLADCEVNTNLTTELRNDQNELLNVSQHSCSSTKCYSNAPVENFNSTIYNILIKANTGFSLKNFSSNISASLNDYLNYSKRLEDCALEVVCTPGINETCGLSSNRSFSVAGNNSAARILNIVSGMTYIIEFIGSYENIFIFLTITYENPAVNSSNQHITVFVIALAITILGIILQVVAICAFCFYSKKYSSCTRLSYKFMLIFCFSLLLLLDIILLVSWITFGALKYDACLTKETTKYHFLIAALIFSVLCIILLFITIGVVLISTCKKDVKRKKDNETDGHELQRSYKFSFTEESFTEHRPDIECASCKCEIISSCNCQRCGKKMCLECYINETNRVFLWRTLTEEAVCCECNKLYWKENEQFSHGSTVHQISDYLRANNPILCNKCKDGPNATIWRSFFYYAYDYWFEKTCVNCSKVLCWSECCYNQTCPQQTSDKKVYCRLCFVLNQRKNHQKPCSA